jgi:PIN domain nuclease of toxin-antitoxin system
MNPRFCRSVMKALLDTGVWLRRYHGLPMSQPLCSYLDGVTEFYLCPLSVAEISFKWQRGKLPGLPDPSLWVSHSLQNFNILNVSAAAALQAGLWDWSHGDLVDRSLAAIEIVNEPEGMIDPRASSAAAGADEVAVCGSVEGVSACAGPHDAVGWSTYKFPLTMVQRFVNRVAGAIRAVEPGVSLTVGSWHVCASWVGEAARTRGARHLFSNACLVAAGGDATGTLDLYQVHAYPKEADGTDFGANAPVGDAGRTAASLGLGAPVILGEVSSRWDVANRGAEPTSARHSTASNSFHHLQHSPGLIPSTATERLFKLWS